ncbi:sulfotransferase 1C2 [Galendromus occidentalis]|uniref:Sulfotransferase 1C2 n=1 Tax=Galendromus occidentalis TaxID=34638 RepID=A0AAJ6VZI1_9ACAR|nr:sulfotransferase 1C2 [Galendromus occidentalis]
MAASQIGACLTPSSEGQRTLVSKRPLYYEIDGFRLSEPFGVDRFRGAVQYKPTPDDVFIVTYPKCGTTWLQEICYLIYNDGNPPENQLKRLIDTPFLEMIGPECIAQMKKPGAVKSHLPFDRMPYSPHAKYIYAIRNPKDCVVSFFYHTSQVYPGYQFADGTFAEFFDLFMKGQTDFGDYFDHVCSWLRQRGRENIHFIYFEDVKKKGSEEILKLGRFLGNDLEAKLKTQGLLEKVLERSSIKTMKEGLKDFALNKDDPSLPEGLRAFAESNEVKTASGSTSALKFDSHLRKGAVNDWRNLLTPEMNACLEAKIKRIIEPEFPELIEKWRQHGVFEPL